MDTFESAAREVAGGRWPVVESWTERLKKPFLNLRREFLIGAVWGRGYLAAQEPTDAEVLAALNSDYALRYGGRGGPAESLELYGDEHVQIMRAALVAARNARQGN